MDLTTTYLGLELDNPLVVASCPLSMTIDGIRELEDNGAGAVVLYSLFEEQIQQGDNAGSYFPEVGSYVDEGAYYLDLIQLARKSTTLPIIASLNGATDSGWVTIAKQIEEAGANALELNLYYLPTDLSLDAAAVEQRYFDVLAQVKSNVSIPVAIKMSPWLSAPGHTALKLAEAGADGLVLFNRYSQPGVDLEAMKALPQLPLSSRAELGPTLLWLSVLRNHLPTTSLAATSGIHSGREVIKAIAAGADVAQVASVLHRHGPAHLATMRRELQSWLEENGYESISHLRGKLARPASAKPASAGERQAYLRNLAAFANPEREGLLMQG
ncbi:MAG: dihydroorotate dehydrogenase-like protein [Planctomycetota bacterium]|jgi:dihydroorotate dehydrogenase (fumarate)